MRFKSIALMLLAAILSTALLSPALAADTDGLQGYSKSAGFQYVSFGAYPFDADGTVRPILWRVLQAEHGEAWLLTEYILFGAPVHGDYEHYAGWESSDLYHYITTVFINDAFSPSEQAALLQRTEDNALVTLLSSNDMKNASIGFNNNDSRLTEATPYAKILQDPPLFEIPKSNNGGRWKPLYINASNGYRFSPWWSRNQSTDYAHEQRYCFYVGGVGRVSSGNTDIGIRPTIYLDLAKVNIVGGTGTKADPYQLTTDDDAPASMPTEIPVDDSVDKPAEEPAEEPVQEPAENRAEATEEPVQAPDPTTIPQPTDVPEKPTKEHAAASQHTPSPDAEEEISIASGGKPIATAEPYVIPVSTQEPEEEPAQPTDQPDAVPQEEPAAVPEVPQAPTTDEARKPVRVDEHFPQLTAEGYLPEDQPEFVYIDEDAGLWLYASQTLRIEINRRSGVNSKKEPLRWYEAHIYAKDASECFDLFPYDEEHYASYGDRYKTQANKIALQHHVVFATNSDFFIYRVEREREVKAENPNNSYPIGLEIRNGNAMFDKPRKAGSTVYPPLDVMALYPDGTLTLHLNGEKTAQELIDAGATDALSFGPILVENGEVSPRSTEFGSTPNPRTAFGVAEPGHYISVMVESRITESKGESCVWLGQKMAELGCQSAINLDGGATSTMIFMGKQINKSGNYGDITNRVQNELLGIGYSESVQ